MDSVGGLIDGWLQVGSFTIVRTGRWLEQYGWMASYTNRDTAVVKCRINVRTRSGVAECRRFALLQLDGGMSDSEEVDTQRGLENGSGVGEVRFWEFGYEVGLGFVGDWGFFLFRDEGLLYLDVVGVVVHERAVRRLSRQLAY
ncbi:hypothetical protein Tco_1352824 [Tanacetum coccineum]